ncbi:MAG: tRNA (adenosine(37)-N6)-threonylcarbamoyltransferase complex dimerization subunit type 1 TsaB [Flavobacteriales bacterium]|nr:tRNA (adenosine(37)-N6)-threonylcarbamoyltransferase complex dimerization subunit type 1 TsaB [Crocinitomicaceae bacterium]NBX80171.1 tRNA (adenosine(37)-N6)-threonylcarbamoyltransferase complex dimerization subunit type 1 TsaB [Flavobacteriales bacterium]NCA20191.1 tRNA (adenosine(37)-N6)-threonylcarbamoyltransferase complex dimerization subunit type 1 TsaB [Crocinitomicaceae bacterium]
MSSVILHIESATKVCSVAISSNGILIDCKEDASDQFMHGESLTLFIEELMHINNLKMNDLAAVSVSSGPGSYTGLRIGISTAKGLCYALNIPLISIQTMDAMAKLGKEKYPNSTLTPMIDARRMEVYCQIFKTDLSTLKELSADIIDENSYSNYEPFVCFGDGAPKMHQLWQNRNIIFDLELLPSAKGQIHLANEKFIKQEFEDIAYFTPFYLKEFMAGGAH